MAASARARSRLRVTGTVQGVGYRPFVYRHAVELGLAGYVLNDSAGVLVDVEGEPDRIAELVRRLVDDAPPLARVAGVTEEAVPPSGLAGFAIVESDDVLRVARVQDAIGRKREAQSLLKILREYADFFGATVGSPARPRRPTA